MAAKEKKKTPKHRVGSNWTFLSNYSHVLFCIVRRPESRMRDIAAEVGITERAVQRIVADLIDAGYLSRIRLGRRNRYHVHEQRSLRHPLVSDKSLRSLLELVMDANFRGGKVPAPKGQMFPTRRRRGTATKIS